MFCFVCLFFLVSLGRFLVILFHFVSVAFVSVYAFWWFFSNKKHNFQVHICFLLLVMFNIKDPSTMMELFKEELLPQHATQPHIVFRSWTTWGWLLPFCYIGARHLSECVISSYKRFRTWFFWIFKLIPDATDGTYFGTLKSNHFKCTVNHYIVVLFSWDVQIFFNEFVYSWQTTFGPNVA